MIPTATQFRRSLREQSDRWDAVGHLAAQSIRDPDWPRSGRLPDLHKHLVQIGAGTGAQKALTSAWAEFLAAIRERADSAPSANRSDLPLRDYLGRPEECSWDNVAFSNLLCPVCYDQLIHTQSPRVLSGEDNYKAGWGGRGNLISIPMWCENGHSFKICLGSHKGETVIYIRNARSAPIPPGEDGPPPVSTQAGGGCR